ncbi:cell division septation protein DedD [Chromobacterium alkanivorans]|uniref:SPOR domain-containing protein n=1 Tax=Chromobacterium alkanivorans TaxID=1071719 RepID=UPI0021678CA6|nr:SPOR domain-containing protein [Chromobacterium alkanivorans]MCS3806902.1 cell division septation protein DedD [Chromobacterium alkanivorans]MCS3821238.1 cell division septation protein DedD [Chromobacterium alkanivorans]MCS3876238.1 cell division septation protein DedD [Chromobacterium alkanivorans]
MREQNQQDPDKTGGEADLNSKLKKRLLIAGGLVAVALAAIPLTDSFNKPKVEMTASSQSPSSGKIIKPASAPAEAPPAPTPASAPAAESSAPATEAAGAPQAPSTASPASPDLDKTPAVVNNRPPAHAAAPAPAPAHERATAKAPAAATPPQAAGGKSAPAEPVKAAPPVAAPVAADKPAAPAKEAAVKAKPAGSSIGYQVQLGLFSSIGNAEKLVKELKQHGIPAHTVTRVQVGPFKSRAEADETMEKLRGLGYAPLLAPAGQ